MKNKITQIINTLKISAPFEMATIKAATSDKVPKMEKLIEVAVLPYDSIDLKP